MGESKRNARSNDYRGPAGPSYTVGFKVIHAPTASWVELHKAELEEAQRNGTPGPTPAPEDMRIGIMLCLLEVVKSPLNMVPDKTMVRPCAVVYSESMDAFERNKMDPAKLDAMDFDVAEDGRVVARGEGVAPIVAAPDEMPTIESLGMKVREDGVIRGTIDHSVAPVLHDATCEGCASGACNKSEWIKLTPREQGAIPTTEAPALESTTEPVPTPEPCTDDVLANEGT